MLALTIWQPWASAIALGAKLVENRDWSPPLSTCGQLIAIHAAKRPMDEDAAEEVFDRLFETGHIERDFTLSNNGRDGVFESWVNAMPMGSVVAVARLQGWVKSAAELREAEQRRWFVGEYGWVLNDVQPLAIPVPCRGLQKLWKLPDDVYQQVQAQLQLSLPAVTG